MRLRALATSLALGAGLALSPVPAPTPAFAQQGQELPADPQDFQCFVQLSHHSSATGAPEGQP